MGRPLFLSFAFITIASALTPSAGASLTLFSPTSYEQPNPTTPPRQLRARDEPYGLCGYVDSTYPWTCSVFSTCYWNTDILGVGCCSSGSCAQFATSCVPYSPSSTLVAAGSNPYITTCSDPSTPYCATATFESGFFEMECWTEQTFWTVFLTYAGGGANSVVEQRLTGRNGAVTVIGSSTIGTSTSTTTSSGTGKTSAVATSVTNTYRLRRSLRRGQPPNPQSLQEPLPLFLLQANSLPRGQVLILLPKPRRPLPPRHRRIQMPKRSPQELLSGLQWEVSSASWR
jgi:hypothetical protein